MIWRLGSATLLAVGVALSANLESRVYACSPPGPEFDSVALSGAIVEGRILGYEALTDEPTNGSFVRVRVDMDVVRVFKGDVAVGPLAIVDPATLMVFPSGESWAGSSGACGAFDDDPTGKYVILGLNLQDDGTLRPSRLFISFFDDGPAGEEYDGAVAYLTGRLVNPILPDTGTGPSGSSAIPFTSLASVFMFAGGLLALRPAVRSLRRRS
jgi:hypothetical protein